MSLIRYPSDLLTVRVASYLILEKSSNDPEIPGPSPELTRTCDSCAHVDVSGGDAPYHWDKMGPELDVATGSYDG